MRTIHGSGNVYEDLGFPDAKEMLVKATLAKKIAELMTARGLSQTAASQLMGLSQPKLSNILRGRFRGISEMRLMECLAGLGQDVQIVVRKGKGRFGRVAVLG